MFDQERALRSGTGRIGLKYQEATLSPSVYNLESLTQDLLLEWDGDYSASS